MKKALFLLAAVSFFTACTCEVTETSTETAVETHCSTPCDSHVETVVE
jgi:hypothetical protein